jgi:hypothetical protein
MEIEDTFYSSAFPVNAIVMLARMDAILRDHGTNNPSDLPIEDQIAFRKVLYLLRNITPREHPGMDVYSSILEDECKICAHYSAMTLAGHEGWCNARGTRPGMQSEEWKCFKSRLSHEDYFLCKKCKRIIHRDFYGEEDQCMDCTRE